MLDNIGTVTGLIELDNELPDLKSIDPAKLSAMSEAYLRIGSVQDADETFKLAAATVKVVLGCSTVVVAIGDGPPLSSLRMVSVLGDSSTRLMGRRMKPKDAGCLGRAFTTRRPCLYRCDGALGGSADPLSELIGTERALSVPLISRGKLIGAIAAYGGTGESYTDEDLFMMRQLAGYAAVSVDNSMLIYELKREKLKSDIVLDRVEDGLLFIGGDGFVAAANKAFLEIFGLSHGEVVDRHISELSGLGELKDALLWPGTTSSAPGCYEYIDCKKSDCSARTTESFRCWTLQPSGCDAGSGKSHEEKLWGKCASCEYLGEVAGRMSTPREITVGGRNLRVSNALVVEEGDNRVFGELVAVQDLTGESAIKRQRSELISMLTHDLRTPLSIIVGYSDIIASHNDVEKMRDMGRVIRNNSSVLIGMINNILEHSSLESGAFVLDKVPVKVATLVNSAIESYIEKAAAGGVTLVMDVPGDIPKVQADIDQAVRMLGNLIANAVKYGPKGGTVRISATEGPPGFVDLTVDDEGLGVPDGELEQVFDAYYRSKNSAGIHGTGLGLSIVRAVAEAHGGKAYARNRSEGGASFGVLLPVARETSG